jgi:hypothetical protein
MTGISRQGGMSAMVNGLLQVGNAAEVYPVPGAPVQARVRHKLGLLFGFESTEIGAAQSGKSRRIGRNRMLGACARGTRDRKRLPAHGTGRKLVELQHIVVLRVKQRYI